MQLAEHLSVSQQISPPTRSAAAACPSPLLPPLARALGVSVEALIGEKAPPRQKRGPAPQLQQKIERLTRLPKAQQRLVMQMLDGVLAQAAQ